MATGKTYSADASSSLRALKEEMRTCNVLRFGQERHALHAALQGLAQSWRGRVDAADREDRGDPLALCTLMQCACELDALVRP